MVSGVPGCSLCCPWISLSVPSGSLGSLGGPWGSLGGPWVAPGWSLGGPWVVLGIERENTKCKSLQASAGKLLRRREQILLQTHKLLQILLPNYCNGKLNYCTFSSLKTIKINPPIGNSTIAHVLYYCETIALKNEHRKNLNFSSAMRPALGCSWDPSPLLESAQEPEEERNGSCEYLMRSLGCL